MEAENARKHLTCFEFPLHFTGNSGKRGLELEERSLLMTGLRTGCIALLGLFALASMGCQNKLHDENTALWRQNRELQSQNRQLQADRDARIDPAQYTAAQQ